MSNKVKKTVSITQKQDDKLDNSPINLSKFLRIKLDEYFHNHEFNKPHHCTNTGKPIEECECEEHG